MFFGFITMPEFNNSVPSIWLTLPIMMFCTVESFRYGFYYLKQVNMDEGTQIGTIFGWLRFNLFLVCYPIGAFSEVVVLLNAAKEVAKTSPKKYSIEMPNPYNFAFDMEYFMYFGIVCYVLVFPQIYMYLVAQRKNYFRSLGASKGTKAL